MSKLIWGVNRLNTYASNVRDYLDAFERLGYETHMAPSTDMTNLIRNPQSLEKKPSIVIDINFNGAAAPALARIGIPYVGIIWDVWVCAPEPAPPTAIYKRNGMDYAFTCDATQVQPLRNMGVNYVEQMHLTTNTERYRPINLNDDEFDKYCCNISFFGTSLIDNTIDGFVNSFKDLDRKIKYSPDNDHKKVMEGKRTVLANVLRYQSENVFDDCLEMLIHREEDTMGIELLDRSLVYARESFIKTLHVHLSMLQRTQAVEALIPYGIKVWGDSKWPKLHKDLNYLGFANGDTELPLIINASNINLNLTKTYSDTALNPRVYDVLACGGFCMTNSTDTLHKLFVEDEHLVVFRSEKELIEKVDYYLHHKEERREIAEAGRNHVYEFHTIDQRVKRIETILKEDGRL